jgi:hypothetical protein
MFIEPFINEKCLSQLKFRFNKFTKYVHVSPDLFSYSFFISTVASST